MDNRMTITRKQKLEEKQLYGRFKRLINNISHKKTWTWIRKRNFKRITESLLIAAQNKAVRTNHIKARIDKTQHNSKCRLWDDRNETINHIISECSKLAQKEYKTRHDWVGKLSKKMTHKLLWVFDIQTDHLISARRPDLKLTNKQKKKKIKKKRKEKTTKKKQNTICKIVDFAVPADHRIKLKESEKKDKFLDFAKEVKKN